LKSWLKTKNSSKKLIGKLITVTIQQERVEAQRQNTKRTWQLLVQS